MPRRRKSTPDERGSAAWLVGHTVVEAAIAWAEAVEDGDDLGTDVAVAGLLKAVRRYLKVRVPVEPPPKLDDKDLNGFLDSQSDRGQRVILQQTTKGRR